jgi:hypothetical protein
MPLYTITATRETYYEFNIEAGSDGEAIGEVNKIELSPEIETYAYDWLPLQIIDVTDEEELA